MADEVSGRIVAQTAAVTRALRGAPELGPEDVLRYEGDGGPFAAVVDEAAGVLGTALYDPAFTPSVRLISSVQTRDPVGLLRTRLERAVARRERDLLGADACRLCHGAADGVPGLYFDRFGDGLVARADGPAAEGVAERLAPIVADMVGAARVVLWRAGAEGPTPTLLRGADGDVRYHHGRLVMTTDLAAHPRVSSLCARLPAQREVRRWARGRVLDVGAADGGFGLQLTEAGAPEVRALASDDALAASIRRDAQANGIDARLAVEVGDPWARMKSLADAGERFEVVVLRPDPRPLAEVSEEALAAQLFDQVRSALRLLDEGRLLVTWNIHPQLQAPAFEALLAEGAARGRKRLQLLRRLAPGPDHPALLGGAAAHDDTTYVLRVVSTA